MTANTKISLLSAAILAVFLIISSQALAASAPSTLTGSANLVAPRNVFLNATVNPNGGSTQVWFDLGKTSSFGDSRGHQYIGNGTSPINVTAGIINLELNTQYFYRAVAKNSYGTSFGETRSFRTGTDGNGSSSSTNTPSNNSATSVTAAASPGSAPSVLANGPSSVTSSSAVLNGSVKPNGLDTKFWFEFGLTNSLGEVTTIGSAGNSGSWQLVEGTLTGLRPKTVYFYRVVAQNSSGTNRGEIVSFTTLSSNQPTTVTSVKANTQSPAVKSAASSPSTSRSTVNNSNSAKINTDKTTVIDESVSNRPSFISLEYSLENDGALVVVSDNLKPKPGEEFSYSVVYKNETLAAFNDASLKVILPPEVQYSSVNKEVAKISGNTVEIVLGDIKPNDSDAVLVTVKVREDASSGSNMVFTAVLRYSDNREIQLATTSYLTARVGQLESNLTAFSVGSLLGVIGNIWFIIFGLLVLTSSLIYRLAKVVKNGKNGKNGSGLKIAGNNFSDENIYRETISVLSDNNGSDSIPVGLPLAGKVD